MFCKMLMKQNSLPAVAHVLRLVLCSLGVERSFMRSRIMRRQVSRYHAFRDEPVNEISDCPLCDG